VKTLRPWLFAVWIVAMGCQSGQVLPRARQDDEGAVYVYLQPLAPEAKRLRLSVDGVAALHRDGAEVPLTVVLPDVKGAEARRQRLLAVGYLPAGEYTGFVLRISRATLSGEAGASAMVVPEAPTRVESNFVVRRGEGAVYALALKYAQAVEAGFRFTPAFSVYTPERPAIGLMGFVANSRSNDITVFEKRTFQVFDVIATGRRPSGLALDQRARRLYVALAADDTVDVIDVLAGKPIDRVRLTPGDQPIAVAVIPDGSTVLAVNRGSNTVSVIDAATRFETSKITVGSGPRSITFDRLGRRAFVFNAVSNSVSVIDVLARTLVKTVQVDPGPVQGSINRRGDRLYVAHELASYVTALDTGTLSVVRRFPIRSPMEAIKVDPATDFVFLAGPREFTVGLYDALSFVPVDFVETGAGIVNLATDSEYNTLYAVGHATNRVLVHDRIRKRRVAELDVGDEPVWLSVMGEN